jgi:hypothetical protein
MPSNEEIFDMQMKQFKMTLDWIYMFYSDLLSKRLDNKLDRDSYMIYDMMDMMESLQNVLMEISKETSYPSYIVEKLERVKAYVDTTYEYFKARGDK